MRRVIEYFAKVIANGTIRKLGMVSYPRSIHSNYGRIILTQYTNVMDRQTTRQTPYDGIGRAYACIARQKRRIQRANDGIKYK